MSLIKKFHEKTKPISSFMKKLKWLDPFTYVDLYLMPKINPEESETKAWIIYLISAAFFAFIFYQILVFGLGTQYPMVIVLSGSMEPEFYRGDIMILSGASEIKAPVVELDYPTLKGIQAKEFVSFNCLDYASGNEQNCNVFKQEIVEGNASNNSFIATEIIFNNNQKTRINQEGDVVVYFSKTYKIPIIHRAVAVVQAGDGKYVFTKGDSVNNPFIDQDTLLSPETIPLKEIQGKVIGKIPLLGYAKLILIDDVLVALFGCKTQMGCPFP